MGEQKTCPECAGSIPAEAEVCGLCGHVFKGGARWRQQRNRRALVFLAVMVVAAIAAYAAFSSALENSDKNACEDTRDFVEDLGYESGEDC